MHDRCDQRSEAWIIDNRDGTREMVRSIGFSVHDARSRAYCEAHAECHERNEREGWERFVAVTWTAARNLGFYPQLRSRIRQKERA